MRFLHRAVERRHGDAVQLDDAGTDLLDRVLFLSELGRVIDLDGIASGRALLDEFAEVLDALRPSDSRPDACRTSVSTV